MARRRLNRTLAGTGVDWAITPQIQQQTKTLRDMLSGAKPAIWDNAAYGDTPQDDMKKYALASNFGAATPQYETAPLGAYKMSNNAAVAQGYGQAAGLMNRESMADYGQAMRQAQQEDLASQQTQQEQMLSALQAKAAQLKEQEEADRIAQNKANYSRWLAAYNPSFHEKNIESNKFIGWGL